MKDFKEIVSQFQIDDVFVSAKPLGHGAINETYEIVCEKDHYVLQEINPVVFRHPADVMSILFLVTEHLKKKIIEEGGDPRRETLEFIWTKGGNTLLQTKDKKFYRMYRMIRGVEAMDRMHTTECARHAAEAYGKFQKRLADLDIRELSETIPRYHDTPYRMKQLLNAMFIKLFVVFNSPKYYNYTIRTYIRQKVSLCILQIFIYTRAFRALPARTAMLRT